MDDTDVIIVGEELRACRVCLATGARLHELRTGAQALADMFVDLTGIPVSPTDGLPQHLCNMCAALLKNAAAFKNRCRSTHVFLQRSCKQLRQYGENKITMRFIQNLDKTIFKLPYTTRDTLTIDMTGYDKNEVKQEIESDDEKIKIEVDHTCKLIDIFDEPMVDEKPIKPQIIKREIFAETLMIKTDSTSFKKAVSKPKRKRAKVLGAQKEENVEEYLKKCKEQTDDCHKKLFYNNILDKYIYKTKFIETDQCDVLSAIEEDTNINSVDFIDKSVNSANENVTVKTESDKNIFFKYIKDKYVRRTLEKKPNKFKEKQDKFAKTYNFEIIKFMKNEQIQNLEARKMSLSYQNSQFTCEECFRGFSTESVYRNHMVLHDPSSGSHVCEVCKVRFTTRKKLLKHLQKHSMKLVCKECKQCFISSTSARQHYDSHMGVSFDCEHCGRKFSKYNSRMHHIRTHHGATACDICYAGFQGVNGVTLHKTKAHQQTYQCDTCAVHFDNVKALKWHLSQSPDGTCDPSTRACAKCGKLCATDEIFNQHVATHVIPKDIRRPKQLKKKHNCCRCQNVESSKKGDSEYNVPVGEHSDPGSACPCAYEDGFTCNCPMGSSRCCRAGIDSAVPVSRVRGRPIWIHKGCCKEKATVVCDICGDIVVGNMISLKAHQRSHEEKRLQCPQCPKKFRTQSNLQFHMDTHSDARPYKCKLCPKAFKSASTVYSHQLVHTKERRYRCEVCDKPYLTSYAMRLHVRTVHMGLPPPPRNPARKRNTE